MGALVRVSQRSRIAQYLGLTVEDLEKVTITKDCMGVCVPVKVPEVCVIKANSRATLVPDVKIAVSKLNVLVSVNPEILSKGIAQCPSVLGVGDDLVIEFTAYKQLDLSTLDYLVKLFIID